MLHAEHAHLCKALPTPEILPDLYSASIITSYEMEEVDAADTRLDKNRRLLRYLERRDYPIKDLCSALDKHEPLKYLAKNLRAGQL